MKKQKFFVICACSIISFFTACQKAVQETEEETEDLISRLPRQIIYTDLSDNYTVVWSVEYDTAHRHINVYSDDTTNTNPYDKLVKSYQFNKDGYLVKFIDLPGVVNDTSIIARDASNQILYITNHDEFPKTRDTSFYTYEAVGTALNVTAKRHSIFTGGREGAYRDIYSYSNHQLQTLRPEPDSIQYLYQYNGNMLTSVGYQLDEVDLQLSCTYATPEPNQSVDYFLELVLGKDHYLQDIRNMYFFFVFRESKFAMLSASDPHHISSFSYSYRGYGTEWLETTTCSYVFNEHNLPITIDLDSKFGRGKIQIRY